MYTLRFNPVRFIPGQFNSPRFSDNNHLHSMHTAAVQQQQLARRAPRDAHAMMMAESCARAQILNSIEFNRIDCIEMD